MDRKKNEVVELQDRTFVIRYLPAAESLAILKDLLTRTVPLDIFSGIILDTDEGQSTLTNILSKFGSSNKSLMTIDELTALENRLFKCVSEKFAKEEMEVIGNYGEFQVDDLEDNLELYFDLLVKIIAFNYKDFFVKKAQALGLINQQPSQELIQSLMG